MATLRSSELALWATMPTHLPTTMSITAVAVGLGGLAEHLGGDLPVPLLPWLLPLWWPGRSAPTLPTTAGPVFTAIGNHGQLGCSAPRRSVSRADRQGHPGSAYRVVGLVGHGVEDHDDPVPANRSMSPPCWTIATLAAAA